MYAGERIGVTGNGKLAAVVIGVEDLEALEEFEMAQDLAAYREAKAADDGGRVTLDELRRGLGRVVSIDAARRGTGRPGLLWALWRRGRARSALLRPWSPSTPRGGGAERGRRGAHGREDRRPRGSAA
jgi:hypothetical protein